MRFYLGTHRTNWFQLTDVPLMVSRRELAKRKRLPRALGTWVLDSGAFTELKDHGRWQISEREYARMVRRFASEVGAMEWAAPMDWPCEPSVVERTGLTVNDHIVNTIRNFQRLRDELGMKVIPVVQGWTLEDYLFCVNAYYASGVELHREPTVGVGSICRRGQDDEIVRIIYRLRMEGVVTIHAFGVRSRALGHVSHLVASADSLAWSYNARRNEPMPGHTHQTCANCLPYALRWRDKQLDRLGLFHEEAA